MNPLDRSIALGPLGVSLGQLLLALAMIVALIVGAWMGRRRQVSVGDLLFNALLIGVIGARIVFVARYWQSYDTFWSWLDIRDRGFESLAGLAIAFVYLAWRFWRQPAMRRPLGTAVLAGALAWSMTAGALALMAPRGASLPSIPLAALDGSTVALPAVLQEADRPMVVNLWASWCPPCRREMPMLEQAQQARDDVSFVFVNQGESVDAVETFLQRESLALDHLYRDPDMTFGREVGAMAMPTTLYYDADGQLVDTHFGELSRATLDRSLERFAP
ncbi:prolipoprotein diacylglyceryl transferase family protein [Salinicola sp. LHM]|jgi:thiol-disulfide isomerase/thioredoxin|uniref:prolipoprotein diacylglyceryl transferase family protein n=1 Tax=Salinicola sp. LHM TaxID=3065298 RepID=UPI002ACEED9F|nr:prolipoprotein diacylglyceryl transferase family protein [Salinicola sp. LHM]WQH33556.1 prolipoprotein diacylglyceryl transferase family protein [Salinicola sp. LHM]